MGVSPSVIVLAGPNGAGKSSVAPWLLQGRAAVDHFVNADDIARGLSAFASHRMALKAGWLMLARLDDLAGAREDFAFETTLASRSFASRLRGLVATGYQLHLLFLRLPSPDLAVARVADRVRRGGHHVPEDVVRRRWAAGARNFDAAYRPLATTWHVYDNSAAARPTLIAAGTGDVVELVRRPRDWARFQGECRGES